MNEQMTYLIFLCIICFFIFPSTFSPPLLPSLPTNPINSKQETFPPEVGWRNLATSPDNNARNFLQISAGGFDINITLLCTNSLAERKQVCTEFTVIKLHHLPTTQLNSVTSTSTFTFKCHSSYFILHILHS